MNVLICPVTADPEVQKMGLWGAGAFFFFYWSLHGPHLPPCFPMHNFGSAESHEDLSMLQTVGSRISALQTPS